MEIWVSHYNALMLRLLLHPLHDNNKAIVMLIVAYVSYENGVIVFIIFCPFNL